jgi:peptidoglycan pentaglycine glycine transferase (the first glycine)
LDVREVARQDGERFDAALARLPQADLLQTHHWAEHKAAYGWHPIYLLVEGGGRVRGACLVLRRRLPGGTSLYYSPRGPALDPEDETAWRALMEAVRRRGRADRAVLWKVDPDLEDRLDWRGLLLERGFRPARRRGRFGGLQPRHVCRLELADDEALLRRTFSAKCRYNIALAERRGVRVEAAGPEGLGPFYALLRETCARDRFTVREPGYFARCYAATVGAGLGVLLLARAGGLTLAGAWICRFGDKAWYLYGASANVRRDLMPNYALQWAAMRWARDHGAKTYDLLGVAEDLRPSHPMYGLYRFKRQFGARLTALIGEFDLPLRPAAYPLFRIAEPLAAQAMRGAAAVRRTLTPARAPVTAHAR